MTLRVAGLGDLHVMEGHSRPYRALFQEIADEADVLALCGDLTNIGTRPEAEILAEDLLACRIPIVGVLGNHDCEAGHPEEVTRILCEGGMKPLESQAREIDGVGFAGVKGFAGGFGRGMLGAFGEPLVKAFVQEMVNEALRLENALRTLRTERTVVVLHYSPVPDTVAGEPPEIFPFLGNSRLAETIDRFPVTVALHGHAHRGTYSGRTPRGVPVYNCAQHVTKPTGRPYALIEV